MTSVLGVPQISQSLLADLDRVGRKYQHWTVQAYFELDGNYLTEYSRGNLEILPMPTIEHQDVARRMYDGLRAAVPREDRVMFAGTRLKVAEDVFREPDVLYIPASLGQWVYKQFAERAALVVEVLSESNRDHDLTTKRSEYAQAKVPEYWIIDPDERQITVLKLEGDHYVVHGRSGPGHRATSAVLPGFGVDVTEILDGV